MKTGLIVFMSLIVLGAVSCKKKGCMDVAANNYSAEAKKDDGSCDYTAVEIIEDITTATTFENKNISICSSISVSAGLTIPAGTTITMCAGASIEIEASGYINAVGTADLPIVIKGATAAPGFWQGIAIYSNNPNNQFSYVTVQDAGTYWAWDYANVYVAGTLSMDHSTISNSEDVGMYVENDGQISNFSANTFSNCVTGINLKPSQVANLDEATNYNSNNTNDFIYVRDGNITVPATWKKTTTPLLLQGLDCESGLTLNPGTKILMEVGSIQVSSNGFLNSVGTATDPISITGRYASAGYWNGLQIGSNNPNNVLKYTTVSDGGKYWAYDYANIHITSGKLDIENCTISNANSYGIYVESNSQIFNSGVEQTTAAEVEGSNTITGNGTGANANCTTGCTVYFN